MTLEELRAALKLLDLEISHATARLAPRHRQGLLDAVSEITEYLLQLHAKVDRLQSRVAVLAERANLKG